MKQIISMLIMFGFAFSVAVHLPVVIIAQEDNRMVYQEFISNTEGRYSDEESITITVLLDDIKIAEQNNLAVPPDYRLGDTNSLEKRQAFSRETHKIFLKKLKENNIQVHKLAEYDITLNGFSFEATYGDAKKIANLNIVSLVEIPLTYTRPKNQVEEQKMVPMDTGSNQMIKVTEVWNKNYTGKGKLIAVIDTGANPHHEIFKDIDTNHIKIKNANDPIYKNFSIARGQRFNDKIPFGYNYADSNTSIKENAANSHGMHVAGIIGAKSNKLQGVAPDAQLAIMRVFSDRYLGTSGLTYNRAIEDAVKIGADAINISIGEPAVSEKRIDVGTYRALQNAQKAGVVVSIAAGNSSFAGFTQTEGPKASNPDYGTLSTPGIMDLSLTVASVNNQQIPYKGIRLASGEDPNHRIHYMESNIGGLSDEFVDFVPVGYGFDKDYQNKLVDGKYVLIKRGDDTNNSFRFDEKIKIAERHNAKGVIIYDNVEDDELMTMEVKGVKIPSAFISKKSGEYLLKHSDVKIKFDKNYNFSDSNEPIRNSDFSSWGVTQEGALKPDITAPGGNIYSSFNEGFGVMSGTSMAAPHVTGAVAMVGEYVSDKFKSETGDKKHALIKNLLMSSAKPVKDRDNNAYLSPRVQGAGLMDISAATATSVVAIGPNNISSINLGNIHENTITFKVKLHNYGKEAKKYTYYTELNTDTVVNGVIQLRPTNILHTNRQEVIINGEQSVAVDITLTLTDEKLDQLKHEMPKGFFLEGYVLFEDKDAHNQLDLSIPFVGFYGDFQNLQVLEDSVYDLSERAEKPYYDNKKTDYFFPFTHLQTSNGSSNVVLGEEKKNGNSIYKKECIAISPDMNQSGDYAQFCGVFLRNYRDLRLAVYRADDVNREHPLWTGKGSKENYGKKNAHFNYNASIELELVTKSFSIWRGVDSQGKILPEGNYVMVVQVKPDNKSDNTLPQTMELPIKIDLTKPDIARSSFDAENSVFKIEAYEEEGSGIRSAEVRYNGKTYVADDTGVIQLSKNINPSKAKIIVYDHAFNKMEEPLNQAIHTGDEYQVRIQAASPLGSISSQDIEWKLETKSGEKINPKDCKPGSYYLTVLKYDKDKYKLFGEEKREVEVKEGNKTTIVDLKFSTKQTKNIYFNIDAPEHIKPQIIILDKFTNEKHTVRRKIMGAYQIELPISQYDVQVIAPEGMKFSFTDLDKVHHFFDENMLDLKKVSTNSIKLTGKLEQKDVPTPKQHRLQIITEPSDAEVIVTRESDNKPIQNSGDGYRVEDGRYVVKVSKDGYIPSETTVVVDSDTNVTIKLNEQEKPIIPEIYAVKFDVTPEDAKIIVKSNGSEDIINPDEDGYRLKAGKYKVVVSKEGYVTQEKDVVVSKNETIIINLKADSSLEEPMLKQHRLQITTEPNGAQVVVIREKDHIVKKNDGLYHIDDGEYRIEVSKDGYQPSEMTLPIDSDTKVKIKLNRQEKPNVPKVYDVKFTTNPEDAEILVKRIGSDDIINSNGKVYQLESGRYNVSVRKKGYITQIREVDINGDETIEIILEKKKTNDSGKTGDIVNPNKNDLTDKEKDNHKSDNNRSQFEQISKDEYNGYIDGYSDGSFKPNNNMTRAEVAVMLSKLIGNQKYDKNIPFSDVSPDAWYAQSVYQLAYLNVISGYEDGKFKPNAKITRAEYVNIIARYKKVHSTQSYFNDVEGHWAQISINAAKENDWIGGYPDGTFKPENNLTRAEAVVITNRVFQVSQKAEGKRKKEMKKKPFTDVQYTDWFYGDVCKAKKHV